MQEPILQNDLGLVEHWRQRLIMIADEAERDAERLNRSGGRGSGLVKAIVVTAASLALAKLLGELFEDR